jgi:A/G-specific adenine glycosylase
MLELTEAIAHLESLGLSVVDVCRQTDKHHIFTHIRWEMRGFYLKVKEKSPLFTWRSAHEIDRDVALPTAFRQFWEEIT